MLLEEKSRKKNKIKFGLKQKLIIYFLIISIVPFFVIMMYNTTSLMQNYGAVRLDQLSATAANKEDTINDWYNSRSTEIQLLSHELNIIDGANVLANYSGDINESEYNSVNSSLTDYFSYLLGLYDNYLEIRLVSNISKITLVVNKEGYNSDVSIGDTLINTKYFDGYSACSTNKTDKFVYIGDIKKDSNQRIYQEISSPIIDQNNGAFLGIISVSLNTSKLSDFMQDVQGIGSLGNIYLVNTQGYFLTINKLNSWFSARGYSNVNDVILSAKISSDGFKECIQIGKSVNIVSTLDYQGKTVMGVYRYLKINSVGTPWVLVIEMDYGEAMAMPLAMVQILIWALVILTIVAIVFGFSISNKIANPIIELNRVTYKIANGDLSNHNILKIKASDEVKELSESFSTMRNRLADIVLKIRAIAEQLSSSSEELSSSVQEISGSAQNIAGTQQQITKGAQEQAKMILDTQDLVKKLAQGIKEVKENSEQITQVTDIVDNIANQTNILSINASIEAVKAGEIGKGFGVVAERIKRLADESKMNLTKTDIMIKNTLETIKTQEDQALNIVNIIDSIASIAEETSASTEEASAASEEIASSMEEITSTAEVLTEYAEELYEHVLFFKTSDDLEQDKNKQTGSEENTKNLKITQKISKYKNMSTEENSSFKGFKKIGDNSYNKASLFNNMKSNVGSTEDDREIESEQLKHLDSAF